MIFEGIGHRNMPKTLDWQKVYDFGTWYRISSIKLFIILSARCRPAHTLSQVSHSLPVSSSIPRSLIRPINSLWYIIFNQDAVQPSHHFYVSCRPGPRHTNTRRASRPAGTRPDTNQQCQSTGTHRRLLRGQHESATGCLHGWHGCVGTLRPFWLCRL